MQPTRVFGTTRLEQTASLQEVVPRRVADLSRIELRDRNPATNHRTFTPTTPPDRPSLLRSQLFGVEYASAASPRDALGRVRTKRTLGGVFRKADYQYDDHGQLTDVTEDGVLVAHYAYDPNGNRVSA